MNVPEGLRIEGTLTWALGTLEDDNATDSDQERAVEIINSERDANWIRVGWWLSQLTPLAIQRAVAALDRVLMKEALKRPGNGLAQKIEAGQK